MNTHANVAFNAHTYRDWLGLTRDDVVLAIAPLFHITGLIGHLAVGMLMPALLVARLPLRRRRDSAAGRAPRRDVHDRGDHGLHRAAAPTPAATCPR